MNEDVFNMSVRKFLKKVGVTAQREIEGSVRLALSNGSLTGHEKLPVKATLTLDGKDHFKAEWVSCKDGKTCHQVNLDLVRKAK